MSQPTGGQEKVVKKGIPMTPAIMPQPSGPEKVVKKGSQRRRSFSCTHSTPLLRSATRPVTRASSLRPRLLPASSGPKSHNGRTRGSSRNKGSDSCPIVGHSLCDSNSPSAKPALLFDLPMSAVEPALPAKGGQEVRPRKRKKTTTRLTTPTRQNLPPAKSNASSAVLAKRSVCICNCGRCCCHSDRPRDAFSLLPVQVLLKIFSFLSIRSHYTSLSRISRRYGRLLYSRAAWPTNAPLLIREGAAPTLDRNRFETIHLVRLVSSHGIPISAEIPRHLLARLGRLGFEQIDGAGPYSLPLVANSAHTERLSCTGLTLSKRDLTPLSALTKLQELRLEQCQASRSDTGTALCTIVSDRLRHITIVGQLNDDDAPEVTLSPSTKLALSRFPNLKSLKLASVLFPENGGIRAVLPRGLQLEDLDLEGSNVSDTCLKYIGAECKDLKSLSLALCNITAAGLAQMLPQLKGLQHLNLSGTELTDDVFTHIADLHFLKSLYLGQSNVTGTGLAALSANRTLEDLNLEVTQTTDNSLVHLRLMPLKKLDLAWCTNITGVGLGGMGGPSSQIEDLNLFETRLTDAGLTSLRGVHTLKKLNLRWCRNITDTGLAVLAGMPLEELNLQHTNITDEGLSHLQGMPLKVLKLCCCIHFTGTGLAYLRGLPIEELNLERTSITDGNLEAFIKDFPSLKSLNLAMCKQITDKGVAALVGSAIQHLDLADTNITLEVLWYLKQMPLKTLNLSGCHCLMRSGRTAFTGSQVKIFWGLSDLNVV